MTVETTKTIISTNENIVASDPSLVRMVVNYPDKFEGPKFYKKDQVIFVSAETAAQFEETGIAKITPLEGETPELSAAKKSLVGDLKNEKSDEQIKADREKLEELEAAELASNAEKTNAAREAKTKAENEGKTHTTPALVPGAKKPNT